VDKSILFIALIEENHSRYILKFTKDIFILSGYEVVYENIGGDIIAFCNGERILIVFDLVSCELGEFNIKNISFDIIVHSSLNNPEKEYLNDLFKMSKVCILNSDEGDLKSLISTIGDVIVITYGFNNKATVTISSYNTDQFIEANLFLQRDVIPINGDKIEPFEVGGEVLSDNEKFIYPVLAAASLSLIIGESILNRKPYKNIKISNIS